MTLPAEILKPITDLASAKQWIADLTDADLDFHFDDSPETVIHYPTGERIFADEDCPTITNQVAALYAENIDWGVYEDPFGYIIAYRKEKGLDAFWTPRDYIEFGADHATVVEVDPTNRHRAILKLEDGTYMAAETTMEDSAWNNFIDLREEATFATVEEARAFLAPENKA